MIVQNGIGLKTLYLKEVKRFLKVSMQTIGAPVVTTLLFLAVFVLALHQDGKTVAGVPFIQFLIPGLIMMAVVQNAFANTSSSLIIGKVNGNIVDTLLAPLSSLELTMALAGGAITRGIVVGSVVMLGMTPFVDVPMVYPVFVIVHMVLGGLMLGLIGILTGIWAEKFDQVATITNFIITPLSFLSGTFYSVENLPAAWQGIAHLNPFFYMIDGIRYAMTGHHDGDIMAGLIVLLGCNVVLWILCQRCFKTGWRLKA
jgi:ABC-2 type transport system permease protein